MNADTDRVIAALRRVGEIWEARLPDVGTHFIYHVQKPEDWTPPEGSTFPWVQVRLSLAALVPGLKNAGGWRERAEVLALTPPSPATQGVPGHGGVRASPPTAALILAGNTPLMSWSPLCACLLAGWQVRVKMSRGETLWPRLFWETLHEADPEVADRVILDVWPAEDARTAELVRDADAVIAFGGDQTLAALRELTPEGTPFFGFGHSISVALWAGGRTGSTQSGATFRLIQDLLLYDQGGCLSPQVLLYAAQKDNLDLMSLPAFLRWFENFSLMDWLEVPVVSDPAMARQVREARDMARFSGASVYGDDDLRWTVIVHPEARPIEPIVGHRVLQIVPISDLDTTPVAQVISEMQLALGGLWGHISSVGMVGGFKYDDAYEKQGFNKPSDYVGELHAALSASGVSRICRMGDMQLPPLDWPNGNIDLLAELLRVRGSRHRQGD